MSRQTFVCPVLDTLYASMSALLRLSVTEARLTWSVAAAEAAYIMAILQWGGVDGGVIIPAPQSSPLLLPLCPPGYVIPSLSLTPPAPAGASAPPPAPRLAYCRTVSFVAALESHNSTLRSVTQPRPGPGLRWPDTNRFCRQVSRLLPDLHKYTGCWPGLTSWH